MILQFTKNGHKNTGGKFSLYVTIFPYSLFFLSFILLRGKETLILREKEKESKEERERESQRKNKLTKSSWIVFPESLFLLFDFMSIWVFVSCAIFFIPLYVWERVLWCSDFVLHL